MHASEVPEGTVVRARVMGWREAQAENERDEPDPDVPALVGAPEFVEGALTSYLVDEPQAGLHYVKYMVSGYDIEADDVERV
jgi:hypothetical protein